MIKTFGDKETEKLFRKEFVIQFQKIAEVAYRKLKMLNNADRLQDLNFPSNRFRKMTGEWKGYYRIWINDQYRIIFQWGQDNHSYQVKVIDYH
ncbi:MAG: type II toxin-antitoxin system RelE/ParE family toxin [Candidatus Moeniiplasma glomeromycotorum]|nr:type II toxin-antitoxin system RelE/ParE family toxin [Candidatus Moeniiplasma glomeromycotorum]MCE8167964.1 type II toxin-antitoxin system RelE/ParE family toxin [Candidatus Moeniiplasma glomeromycotorum]MCE8169201.1 type II toxin-antitoxin system RelE/ParE family toxin [Candidatus Moeniiplasma glomeromycotorum]